MESLKAAVIGVGNMGQHHARVYSEIDACDLVGVADPDKTRAAALAKKLGTDAFADYTEMLSKTRPDVVSVAVPTALHSKVGLDALKAADVLIEKPIALSEDEANQLIKASDAAGRKLMVGHIERFNPAVEYLKNMVDKNGQKILSLETMRLGIAPPAKPSTGVIVDLAIHDIDIVRFLTGEEVVETRASAKSFGLTPFEDHAHVFLKTPGASASIVANWITPHKIRHVYATLSKTFVYLNYITQTVELYEKAEFDPFVEEGPKRVIELRRREPLRRELEAFLECVRRDAATPVTGKDGLESLRVALEARKAAA
jgi:UDP-N-acetylglucosamine 3-dehydrogenase